MAKDDKPSQEDIGAALLAWYAEALQQFPDGLVSQAQAAQMLGIGRMAVSRLVARAYLRAVYFPKPPDIAGVAVGEDDPTWLKLAGWFGKWVQRLSFPSACYVSLGDVIELWRMGDARKKCKLNWDWMLEKYRSKREDIREPHAERELKSRVDYAESLLRQYKMQDSERPRGSVAGRKLYLNDKVLGWFEAQAQQCELTRNQLLMWAAEQWRKQIEEGGTTKLASLPSGHDAMLIRGRARDAIMEQCKTDQVFWVIAYDECGGELGVFGSTGLMMDGGVG